MNVLHYHQTGPQEDLYEAPHHEEEAVYEAPLDTEEAVYEAPLDGATYDEVLQMPHISRSLKIRQQLILMDLDYIGSLIIPYMAMLNLTMSCMQMWSLNTIPDKFFNSGFIEIYN